MSENENLGQTEQELDSADTQETEAAATKASKSESVKKNKDAKKDAPKKPGFFARTGRWLRELKSEMKKVSWLTIPEILKRTGIVLLCVLAVGVCIWIFDELAHSIIDALFNLFS
ncbi:MAG: Preprotein translocase subunit SecE [Oscillospiraceae bacterium]|nr:Preprotein translocase subunit SecE [Oscillospiraceae bacterium]